jgi:hypothetical protein
VRFFLLGGINRQHYRLLQLIPCKVTVINLLMNDLKTERGAHRRCTSFDKLPYCDFSKHVKNGQTNDFLTQSKAAMYIKLQPG